MDKKDLKEQVQECWESKMDEVPENHPVPDEIQEKLKKAGWI